MTEQEVEKKQEILIAVYGTLRKDFHNYNTYLNAGRSKWRGALWITDYLMKSNGSFPAAVAKEGYQIWAEVYEIGPEVLESLDHLEGIQYGFYKREEIFTMTFGKAPIWIYTQTHKGIKEGDRWVHDGKWRGSAGMTPTVTWQGDEKEAQLLGMQDRRIITNPDPDRDIPFAEPKAAANDAPSPRLRIRPKGKLRL